MSHMNNFHPGLYEMSAVLHSLYLLSGQTKHPQRFKLLILRDIRIHLISPSHPKLMVLPQFFLHIYYVVTFGFIFKASSKMVFLLMISCACLFHIHEFLGLQVDFSKPVTTLFSTHYSLNQKFDFPIQNLDNMNTYIWLYKWQLHQELSITGTNHLI